MVISDILKEFENNPDTKLIIFSQYPESLDSAMKMFKIYNIIHKHRLQIERERENILNLNENERGIENEDLNLFHDIFSCVIVGGKESSAEREENLRKFNEDPSCNVCFLSTGIYLKYSWMLGYVLFVWFIDVSLHTYKVNCRKIKSMIRVRVYEWFIEMRLYIYDKENLRKFNDDPGCDVCFLSTGIYLKYWRELGYL